MFSGKGNSILVETPRYTWSLDGSSDLPSIKDRSDKTINRMKGAGWEERVTGKTLREELRSEIVFRGRDRGWEETLDWILSMGGEPYREGTPHGKVKVRVFPWVPFVSYNSYYNTKRNVVSNSQGSYFDLTFTRKGIEQWNYIVGYTHL